MVQCLFDSLTISFFREATVENHSLFCVPDCVFLISRGVESAQILADIIFRSSQKCFSFYCQRDVSILCSVT